MKRRQNETGADPRLCRSLVLPDRVRRAGSGLDVKLGFSSVPNYSQDPEKDVIAGIVPSGC
jgi:hypothetical protein